MKPQGVIDARVSLMREAQRIGELDEALAVTLDEFVDNWRAEPRIGRWWETFEDLSEWIDVNRRTPTYVDSGAAGLLPWLEQQDGSGIEPAQLSALLSLSAFPVRLTSELMPLICSMAAAGVVPSRADDRAVINELIARAELPQITEPLAVLPPQAPQLLSYLMFAARTGRQPTATEPNGCWIRACRTDESLAPELREILGKVGDWRGEQAVSERFERWHLRWVAAGKRAGRRPSRRSTNVEERACASWASRARRQVIDGRLSDAEAQVVSSMP
tara:strand:- start:1492 stop:2313 length:822 start_codon:yes stop_codon:yes gene_type:complete